MNFKLVFATATAVGLFMGSGAALAGSNQLYLSQTGNSQTATITQSGGSGDRVGGSPTSPFVQQNGAGTVGTNTLTIDQNTGSAGSGNVATGYQSGSKNNADVDQDGNYSSVNLTQSGALNGADTDGWFNDPGTGNRIVQASTANSSSVSLQQSNYIYADRGSIFNIGQGGYNNHLSASQTANSGQANSARNDLWIRQGATSPDLWGWTFGNPFWTAGYALSNSSITINQNAGTLSGVNYAALGQGDGSGNAISVVQSGASNSLDANQVGNNNSFNSKQYSTDGNAGWNFVGGESGWPDSTSHAFMAHAGDFQPVTQWGTGNSYNSVQSGSNLWAFGSQVGNYNYLSNTQSGDSNSLFTSQYGDSNAIYSTQAGDSNVTTVSQTLNSNLSVTSQNGTGNIATVSQ